MENKKIEDLIIDYLELQNSGKTPTQIGMALGKCYTQASSSVNYSLKKLIRIGKIKRQVPSPGKVIYSINKP